MSRRGQRRRRRRRHAGGGQQGDIGPALTIGGDLERRPAVGSGELQRLLDWRLPRQARHERLDQQFQTAFIDNGDGVFRAMSANVAFNLVGVTRLSRPDFPIVIDTVAAKNW